MPFAYYCGRRPKNEGLDNSTPFPIEEEEVEEVEEEEEVDEEVDFDRQTFKTGERLWSDYAEDLDFDQ